MMLKGLEVEGLKVYALELLFRVPKPQPLNPLGEWNPIISVWSSGGIECLMIRISIPMCAIAEPPSIPPKKSYSIPPKSDVTRLSGV